MATLNTIMANDDRYLDPYRESIGRHGAEFEATLWASPKSQVKRFEVFAQMAFMTGKRVLDVGCSRGDLAAYLSDRGIRVKEYIGIDALEEVITFAQQRDLPRSRFVVGDCVQNPAMLAEFRPDIVCISGTLNTMDDAQVMRVLDGSWAAAKQALLFNFLSDTCHENAPLQDQFARRLDTMGLLAWAMGHTWSVKFRQDYFNWGHDATIGMRRV